MTQQRLLIGIVSSGLMGEKNILKKQFWPQWPAGPDHFVNGVIGIKVTVTMATPIEPIKGRNF